MSLLKNPRSTIFWTLLLVSFQAATLASDAASNSVDSTQAAIALVLEVETLKQQNRQREAIELLENYRSQRPASSELLELEFGLLMEANRYSEARNLIDQLPQNPSLQRSMVERVEQGLDRVTRNDKLATIFVQKRIEVKDFETAIEVIDRAAERYPSRQGDFFTLKGEALYKRNDLESAEIEFMRALQIDPLNEVAKSYVREIRTTLEAQTSTALAEWIRIAKDKTGDFVVTFLALFTAFLMNSLLSPLSMRFRLWRARSAFDAGNYDDFADAIERLLDQEDFRPLRQNLRILLGKRSYDDIKAIFEHHVMTQDRLPTLLRILQREHERLAEL